MKKTFHIFSFMVGGVVTVVAEPTSDIPLPQQRASMVGFAKEIISLPTAVVEPVNPATLKNPFDPAQSPSVPSQQTASVSPTAQGAPVVVETGNFSILEVIAPKVTPTGSVELGGELLLLFGQKRLKVGDHLPIVFEGKPYDLEISGIQSTNFTLRLNGAEITRPIKSVKKP